MQIISLLCLLLSSTALATTIRQNSGGHAFSATDIFGGSACQIPFQTAANATSFSSSLCWTNSTSNLAITPLGTIANSTVQSGISVTPNYSSLGSASVGIGVYALCNISDTASHVSDATHVPCIVGRSSTTAGGKTAAFGIEGRVDVRDYSNPSTNQIKHIGGLGYIDAVDSQANIDTNILAGLEGRACKTKLADCGGTPVSTGNVVGLYIGQVVGGGSNIGTLQNWGVYQASGTYNSLTGYTGIGPNWSFSNPPALPLDVNNYDGTNFGVMRLLSGAAGSSSMLLWGRATGTLDAYMGFVGAATAFCGSAAQGDWCYRLQSSNNAIWTADSTGARNDIYLRTTGQVGFGVLPTTNAQVYVKSGTSNVAFAPGGYQYVTTASTNTIADTNEKVLYSTGVAAGVLANAGDTLKITCDVAGAATATTKRLRIRFNTTTLSAVDGTILADTTAVTANGVLLTARASVVKTTSNAQVVADWFSQAAGTVGTAIATPTLTATDTGVINIACTCQNGTANNADCVGKAMTITKNPAP